MNLLSRGMDRERVGEAHPAFIQIVGQLAPDEAVLIEQISAGQLAA
ncbi:Abi-alpha family protein [Cupriavidus plantarum]|nr:Abi-alpha family protein [Cupriavidus plantarum]